MRLVLVAAQMWNLMANLSVMIGHKVPRGDGKWECFLFLVDIVKLCSARTMAAAHAGYLGVLINEHHQQFVKCYPGVSITPKLHYMVHFPKQIKRYVCIYFT